MDQQPTDQQSTPVAPVKSKTPLVLGILGGLVAIGIIGGVIAQKNQPDDTQQSPATSGSQQTPQGTPPQVSDNSQVNEVSPVPSPSPTPAAGQPAPTPSPAPSNASGFKDGTYQADGTYRSPAGEESVHISVTLKDGIVTDTTFQGGAQAPRSQQFQGIFAQNYKSLVVGKKIDQIQLSEVSGSSLTPIGFNDALAKIEAQAKL